MRARHNRRVTEEFYRRRRLAQYWPMIIGALLTYQDIAQFARVHPRTVQRWIKRRNLPVIRPTACTVRVTSAVARLLIGTPASYTKSLKNLAKRPA